MLLSHKNIMTNIVAAAKAAPLGLHTYKDIHLTFLPWAHIYGQTVELYNGLYHGFSMGLVRNPHTLMEDMHLVQPTVIVSVPALFQRIYNGVQSRMSAAPALTKALFRWAMNTARDRRLSLDSSGRMYDSFELFWS